MEEKKKKPVHKKWWFWLIGVIIVLSWYQENDEQTEQPEEVNNEQEVQEEPKEKEEGEKEEEEEESEQGQSKEQSKEKVIELNEEIPFADFTAKIQRVKVKDDRLTIVLDWTNQSGWNPAHFSLLAGIDVYQDDEMLEVTKGEDRLLKRIPKDRFDVVDLEYKLKDNETPVRVRIIPWNEYDEKKELTIEIN